MKASEISEALAAVAGVAGALRDAGITRLRLGALELVLAPAVGLAPTAPAPVEEVADPLADSATFGGLAPPSYPRREAEE